MVEEKTDKYLTFTFCILFNHAQKVSVKVAQYQGQIKGDPFSVYCKCFCDLCVMQMVRLRLKGILIYFLFPYLIAANSQRNT